VKKIPHPFHSFETDAPFTHCCDCNCELIQSAQMYMIQKNYDGDECVMEYALCSNCKDFLFDNAAKLDGPEQCTEEESMQQIETCLTCGVAKDDCKSHTYSGLFVGTELIPGPMPMMICGTCQEQIAEGLSDHTRDVRNKFYEENFPSPPSQLDLPKTSKPLVF